jgi:hypothetical protein
MSPQLVVTSNEISGSGTGIPTGTGSVFVAGVTDAGPPAGPLYYKVQSLAQFVSAFGPRSSSSAVVYDFLSELFQDGGQSPSAYVTRVTDSTATTATLTLNDGQSAPKPTVLVSALTPGTEGSLTAVSVTTGTAATFTANTASSSTLSSISSFKNIAAGTPITGTGIPAGTYIVSVNTAASTAVLSAAATATATGVTITPGTATVTIVVNDSSGNQIANETHGPYNTQAQLLADTSSSWVSFTQSAASGFSSNLPSAAPSASLTGGTDANDLTPSSYVSALGNFPASLGPGTVCIPGQTGAVVWAGLLSHAQTNNRFAVLDMVDNTSAASVEQAAAALTAGSSGGYGMFIQGSVILPGIAQTANQPRTVPGSAAVAAVISQVAQQANQAQAPCGNNYPLSYPLGFTTFFGPLPAGALLGGCYSQSDVNNLDAAPVPVNVFANFYGTLCLFGFKTLLPASAELIYDQATASRERMALTAACQAAMAPFLFDPINLETIDTMNTVLNGICLGHYASQALYDGGTGQAAGAFFVNTGPQINTSQTAQAQQLNAQITVKIVRYADSINIQETMVPVSVALPSSAA